MDENENMTPDQANQAVVPAAAAPARRGRRRLCLAVGLVGFVLIAALFLLSVIPVSATPPMPSFRFLSGQAPVSAVAKKDIMDDLSRKSLNRYSFAGDFQSVCNAAHAELSALGYVETKHPSGDPDKREYRLRTGLPDRLVTVWILDHSRLIVYSSPKDSEYSTPDRCEYKWQEGWVSVEVRHAYRGPWPSDDLEWMVMGLLRKVGLCKTP